MLPLEGIKVLDFSRFAPGRYCSMILADFGADVITVEPARTEQLRIPPIEDTDPSYYCFARNKRSIALNLRIPEAREVIYKLVKSTDVVIEGFRPGVAAKLGIDYYKLSQLNPKLIYCSLSGFGQDGPYAQAPGHDLNYLAIAGILDLTKCSQGHPAIIGTQIADLATAWNATIGILIALIHRERTGKGQYIDVSYLDCAIALHWILAAELLNHNKISRRLLGDYASYNIYQTKDGSYITLGIVMPFEPWFWENLCKAIRHPDLIQEFHKPETIHILNKIFQSKSKSEWESILKQIDIPWAPINTLEEALKHPQVIHRKLILKCEHSKLGNIKLLRNPIRFSNLEPQIRSPPHMYGEHTVQILKELGYTDSEIQRLKEIGAIEPS
jgi:crotonobetainyl-CoA:carnitine CoA-transferase CaiB-like acyl-CoA transferase